MNIHTRFLTELTDKFLKQNEIQIYFSVEVFEGRKTTKYYIIFRRLDILLNI